jgi:lipoyl synthase
MSVVQATPKVSLGRSASAKALHVRWLGKVPYAEALSLQQSLFNSTDDYLLLMEHPPVVTMGVRAKAEHVLDKTIETVEVNRGGDVTYHGPGQLVGYPILSIGGKGGLTDTTRYVESLEQLIIDTLGELGVEGATRRRGTPGVWIEDRKIAAVGVRVTRGRSMHGFALNVNTDLSGFDSIVPCGLRDTSVTSLAAEGVTATLEDVAAALVSNIDAQVERQDVAWRRRLEDLSAFSKGEGPGATTKPSDTAQPVRMLGRLQSAGVDTSNSLPDQARKPEWMRVKANYGPKFMELKKATRESGLVTVCEEAGCPNIFDCWNEGTATFMINGERCTRACGFCLVDTRKPLELDAEEPARVASSIERMGLDHAVITVVARDDLSDGGAGAVARTVRAVHERCPETAVEVLISDCKGDRPSQQMIFDSRPEVLNHNVETIARLQRAVRPSAGYARSLSVLARAKQEGLVTKSGFMVGLGETWDEVAGLLGDLSAIGVDIVTVGQYLRPTTNHLPMSRWWTPEEFDEIKRVGEAMGIDYVQSSPLTRSSHNAKQAYQAALALSE